MQGCAKSQICGSIYPSASLLLVWYPSIVASVGTSTCARSINVQVAINIANLLPLLRVSTEASNWNIAINTRDGGNKRGKPKDWGSPILSLILRSVMLKACASSQVLLMLILSLYVQKDKKSSLSIRVGQKNKKSLLSIRVSFVRSSLLLPPREYLWEHKALLEFLQSQQCLQEHGALLEQKKGTIAVSSISKSSDTYQGLL
jgi:hypothetical protein